jgi:hypothetical protein
MPQWDRWWPLGLAGGVALLAAGATLGLWYLASLFAVPGLPLPASHDNSGLVLYICLLGAMWLLSRSLAARRRVHARRAALAGDVTVMWPSIIQADAAQRPDVSELPITLAWRPRPKRRGWGGWLLLALIVSTVVIAIPVVLALLAPWPWTIAIPSITDLLEGLFFIVLFFAQWICLVVGAIGAWVAFAKAVSAPLGPVYGVRADDDGIRTLHLLGEGPLLHWSDVRLFEVSGSARRRVFSVYAADAMIWWQSVTVPDLANTAPEMDRRDRQWRLLALAVARLGQQPVTCTPALIREAPPGRLARRYRLRAYSISLGLPLVLFVVAAASLVLPLSPLAWLNWYAALSTALMGVAIMWATRMALWVSPRLPYALPAAPALPAEPLTFTFSRTTSNRFRDIGIGVLCLLNVIPVAVASFNLPASPAQAYRVQVVDTALIIVLVIGLIALINGLGSGRTHLKIQRDGLATTHGYKATWLEWGAIVRLQLEMLGGRPLQFIATGRDGETIGWPARDVVWRVAGRGQPPLSPDELAALVAARSGAALVID